MSQTHPRSEYTEQEPIEEQHLLSTLCHILGIPKTTANTIIDLKPTLERLEVRNKLFEAQIKHAPSIAGLPGGGVTLQYHLEKHVRTTLAQADQLLVAYCGLPLGAQNVVESGLAQRILVLPVDTAGINMLMRKELGRLGVVGVGE